MSLYEKVTGSRLYSWGDKLGDLMILSLLWLAFSLPVVTIGTSTAALYYATTRRFYHDSATPGRDFMRSFRQNLRQGTIITLIYLVYCALLAFDLYAARNGINGIELPQIYEQIAYVLTLPVIFTLPFVFAYLSRFNDTVMKTLKHSFMLCASHPVHTIGIMLIILVSAILMAFVPAILLVPASCAYLCSRLIERDFRKALGIDTDVEDGDPDSAESGRDGDLDTDETACKHSYEDTHEESSISNTD